MVQAPPRSIWLLLPPLQPRIPHRTQLEAQLLQLLCRGLHLCARAHTHTNTRTHARTHAHTHTRTHTHAHTNTHTHTPSVFFPSRPNPLSVPGPVWAILRKACFDTSGSGGQARREASRQTRDAPHIQNYTVWRPDAKVPGASPQNAQSYGPFMHGHHLHQPLRPCCARIQPRPIGLWVGDRPHTELALEPPCTRCEVTRCEVTARCSCLSNLRWGFLIHFIVLNMRSSPTEVGTMTSTSSARSIHSGKRSLPPPNALCCCQNFVVLGDCSSPTAVCLLAGCSCCCCCCYCARRLGCSPLQLLLPTFEPLKNY